MPDPTTHDLSCIAPILETGQRIPGFVPHPDTGSWMWLGFLGTYSLDRVPAEARNAAIGWLVVSMKKHDCWLCPKGDSWVVISKRIGETIAEDTDPLAALCTA
jgi:hypothetical protein